jgi:Tfp pilus assembly protein PilF
MGNSYLKKGDFTKALESFKVAFSLSPKNTIISNSVGFLHYKMGNLSASKEAFEYSLSIDKNNGIAKDKISEILCINGDFHKGLKMYYEVNGKITFTDKVEIK